MCGYGGGVVYGGEGGEGCEFGGASDKCKSEVSEAGSALGYGAPNAKREHPIAADSLQRMLQRLSLHTPEMLAFVRSRALPAVAALAAGGSFAASCDGVGRGLFDEEAERSRGCDE
jgi:hypothetical protein